jgi:hypothetical protein
MIYITRKPHFTGLTALSPASSRNAEISDGLMYSHMQRYFTFVFTVKQFVI